MFQASCAESSFTFTAKLCSQFQLYFGQKQDTRGFLQSSVTLRRSKCETNHRPSLLLECENLRTLQLSPTHSLKGVLCQLQLNSGIYS